MITKCHFDFRQTTIFRFNFQLDNNDEIKNFKIMRKFFFFVKTSIDNSFVFLLLLSKGIGNSCGISQIGNSNGQPQSNEFNEPYDNNSLIDIAVGSHFLNGGQERSSYTSGYGAWDMENVDLSDDFKKHYEVWLQKEVFNIKIDWDSLRTVYDIEMDDIKVNGKTLNGTGASSDSKVMIQSTQ